MARVEVAPANCVQPGEQGANDGLRAAPEKPPTI
jgi:hypothetical protein